MWGRGREKNKHFCEKMHRSEGAFQPFGATQKVTDVGGCHWGLETTGLCYFSQCKSQRTREFPKGKFKGSFLAFGEIPGDRKAKKTEAQIGVSVLCLLKALYSPCHHSLAEQSELEDTAVIHWEPTVCQARSTSSSGVLSQIPPGHAHQKEWPHCWVLAPLYELGHNDHHHHSFIYSTSQGRTMVQ